MRALREVVLVGGALWPGCLQVATLLTMWSAGTAFILPIVLHLTGVSGWVYVALVAFFSSVADLSTAKTHDLPTLPVSKTTRVAGITLAATLFHAAFLGGWHLGVWLTPASLIDLGFRLLPGDPVRLWETTWTPDALARLSLAHLTLRGASVAAVTALARGERRSSWLASLVGAGIGLADLLSPDLWPLVLVFAGAVGSTALLGLRWPFPAMPSFGRQVPLSRPYRSGWRAGARDLGESVRAGLWLGALPGVAVFVVGGALVGFTRNTALAIVWVVSLVASAIGIASYSGPFFFPMGARRIPLFGERSRSDLPGLPLLPVSRKRYVAVATLQSLILPTAVVAIASSLLGYGPTSEAAQTTALIGLTLLNAQFAFAWRDLRRSIVSNNVTATLFFIMVIVNETSGTATAMAFFFPSMTAMYALGVAAVLRGGR